MTIYTVTTATGTAAGSLPDAISQAQDGDTIVFSSTIANSTIALASTLTVTSGVTIDGGNQGIVISGQNNVTDFTVNNTAANPATTTIENLAINDGNGVGTSAPPFGAGTNAAGGIFETSGSLNLINDLFANNSATGGNSTGSGYSGGSAAGAVYVQGGTINASNLTAYNDTAFPGMGGGTGSNGTAYPVSNNSTVTNATTTTACYCTGTLIRVARDGVVADVAVEHLVVGDLVVTASGAHRPIRWIGHRSYVGRFANANPEALPICFTAGSLSNGVPARDLWVSPKHAMFLDGALVAAELLVNGVSVVKAERVERVAYWHVELDSHDVLIAEGAPSESFVDDNSRGMFHNAPAFWAAHPEAVGVVAVYCAPRLEDGYELEAIRQAIAARAGLAVAAPECGVLHGYVDAIEDGVVRGWARSALNPAMAVCLDLLVDGRVVATSLANRRRADLDAAGYGPRGFAFVLPPGAQGKRIEVRRSADGARMKVVLDRAA